MKRKNDLLLHARTFDNTWSLTPSMVLKNVGNQVNERERSDWLCMHMLSNQYNNPSNWISFMYNNLAFPTKDVPRKKLFIHAKPCYNINRMIIITLEVIRAVLLFKIFIFSFVPFCLFYYFILNLFLVYIKIWNGLPSFDMSFCHVI